MNPTPLGYLAWVSSNLYWRMAGDFLLHLENQIQRYVFGFFSTLEILTRKDLLMEVIHTVSSLQRNKMLQSCHGSPSSCPGELKERDSGLPRRVGAEMFSQCMIT